MTNCLNSPTGCPAMMLLRLSCRLSLLTRIVSLAALAWLAQPALCQYRDAFEGGQPRWLLVESDCQAQLRRQEISLTMPHSGRTCELLELDCGQGTLAALAYPIEPCVVINEFEPHVWVRCSSGPIRLGVRVVFPGALHPVTGGRLTTVLWGSTYSNTGHWQDLSVEQMEKLLAEEMIAIRNQLGSKLNLEEPYIDTLLLNAYTGPGRYRLQTDDLDLTGQIPLASIGRDAPINWRQSWRWRHTVPSPEQRYWGQVNEPPIWLAYQNESLPWLKSLGVNGIVMGSLPDEKTLLDVADAGLVAVCPPPRYNIELAETAASVIKGWLIGAALNARQTEMVQAEAARAAALNETLRRPLVGESLEQHWRFARIADELIVSADDATSPVPWHAAQEILSGHLREVQERTKGWVSIDIDVGPAVEAQYQAARSIRSFDDLDATIANPLGFRHRVIGGVVAGGRGVLLRPSKQLVISEAADRAQVAAIRWVNNDLRLWGPWLVGGAAVAKPMVSRGDFDAAAWSCSESYLVVAQSRAKDCHYCLPATAAEPLQIQLPTSTKTVQVLRLTRGHPEPIRAQVTPAGLQWEVSAPAPVESFVITGNPTVYDFVRRTLKRQADSNAADQLEIVAYAHSLAMNLVRTRFSVSNESRGLAPAGQEQLEMLASAQRQLDGGWQALRTGQSHGATSLALAASDVVQAVLYDGFQTATSNLSAPQSSPFVLCPATLPLHWSIAEACEKSSWQAVPLPGSQFSDLGAMLNVGWSQERRLEDQVELRVELVPRQQPETGGLRLAAYGRQASGQPPVAGGYAGASLRVRSAAAPIEKGRFVRLSATARILRPSVTPDSGVLIYDNQAGPSMGQLIRGEAGERVPVELYRFMVSTSQFHVLAECRGECDVVLEDIQLSQIEPAAQRVGFDTNPLSLLPEDAVFEPAR